MPTDVDKLIEAGHDINSFGPAVLAQLVQAGVLTVHEARRALRLPPIGYQAAGEQTLYNAPPLHSNGPLRDEDLVNQPGAVEVDETPSRPPKQVYRPTTPAGQRSALSPKRGRPVKARPEYNSKFPPSFKQQGLLEHLRRESGLSDTDLDAIAVEEARAYSNRKKTADVKFVTGWYSLSKMVASQVIDRMSQDASDNDNQDEDEFGKF